MSPHLAIAAVVLSLSAPAFADTSADAGKLAFNNACRTCHTLKDGDNRLGPNLHAIVGRKAGSVADYNYSSAMKQGHIVWDVATLDRFIANPDQVVPGHRMKPYGGIASEEERARIIAYLEQED